MPNIVTEEEIDIDLIEKYQKGLLNGASLESFLEREKHDKDFADKVKSYLSIIAGIEYYGKQKDFADTVRDWESEIKDRDKKKQGKSLEMSPAEPEKGTFFIGRKSVYWLAAAVVSLLIVSSVFLFQSSEPDTLALYNSYYQPYPNLFYPAVRGDSDTDTISISKKALRAYNQGDYKTAANYFREALTNRDEIGNEYGLLYLGNCLLALDSLSAAKNILQQINEQSPVVDQAKWYLALAHLKSKELEEAGKVLGELTDHANSYRDKAIKILQEINK